MIRDLCDRLLVETDIYDAIEAAADGKVAVLLDRVHRLLPGGALSERFTTLTLRTALLAATYDEMISETWSPSTGQPLIYALLGLGGETGECLNIAQKCMRGDFSESDLRTVHRDRLVTELGGVFYYLHATCAQLGVTPEEVMAANATKLRSRLARGTIRGDGDDR